MKTLIPRKISWITLGGATCFLVACINSTEDLPIDPIYQNVQIDARMAGKTLSGSFDQGKGWDNAMTTPKGFEPLGSLSTKVGALKKNAALPKQSDLDIGGGIYANLDDTAASKGGVATLYSEKRMLLVIIKDTAIVKWDDHARDEIKDNENIISWKRISTYFGGKVETAEFKDGDKDGFVNAVPGKDSRVRINLSVENDKVIEKTTLLVGAGPDSDFDSEEDNIIYEANWTKSKSGIALGQGAYLDGDKDGIVVDNGKTCIVLIKYSEIGPKDRPDVKKTTVEAKIRVFPKSTGGDEPVTFAYEEEMVSGRINSATIKNRAGGPEFVRGDTMTVKLETTVSNSEDTLKHAVIEYVMNPGKNLNSDSDDSCYAIHITTEKKFGLERSAKFNFVSANPIPHGQDPTAGTFDGQATYANGKTVRLKGQFSPAGYSAEYIGPEGESTTVTYSKEGDLLAGGKI